MPRPSHFEIPVDDPQRAEKFYREVFGWETQSYEGSPSYYGMTTTGPDSEQPGINGALFQRGDTKVVSITVSVDSVEESLKTVEKSGGKILSPKTAIPGMGWYATFLDTEGNQTGLYEDDTSAS